MMRASLMALLLLVACSDKDLPPLLRQVSAGRGGWASDCHPQNESDVRTRAQLGPPLSPEFDARLKQQFPPGSTEEHLIGTLKSQGFQVFDSCENDRSIRFAVFRREAGWTGLVGVWARIFWRVDQAGKLVWTGGEVAFTGP